MRRQWFRWWWLLFLIPVALGITRLHFDTEVLDLLPANNPSVQGLKIYQQYFANARQLVITVKAQSPDDSENTARAITENLRATSNLVADATWQAPWQEHPDQTAELIAYLWLNQPPQTFSQLAGRLAATNLSNIFADTRDQLQNSLSPNDIGRLSYDPLGFTQLPQNSAAPSFTSGRQLFSSSDGTFHIIFVEARGSLKSYIQCASWMTAVGQIVTNSLPAGSNITLGYTGRPIFVNEMAGAMKHDIGTSVVGTSVIIAILFWLAHRRLKPMIWLLTLLALILAFTLALGGLIFGAVNVLSMGFAAILLGLAVDYAVVHYQEALAHPDYTIPEVRREIAPAIFWAAVTTISSFLVLNLGGLPGLAQLGTLVAVGVALAAMVMIFAYLPPLFPHRMQPPPNRVFKKFEPSNAPLNPARKKIVFTVTALVFLACLAVLSSGLPKMDGTANALQPRHSPAFDTMQAISTNLNQPRQPLWIIVSAPSENEIAQRLDAIEPILQDSVSNHTLTGFDSPAPLWPRQNFQAQNFATAKTIIAERDAMQAAAATNGFAPNSLGLANGILDTWQRAAATSRVFWPTNYLSTWIFDKLIARTPTNLFAVTLLYPAPDASQASLARLDSRVTHPGVLLSSWELLGGTVLAQVKRNMWKLLIPMVTLVLLTLYLAFRRFTEIAFSIAVLLLSGACLLSMMKLFGWSWNLLNLMALPLILGTGVDYSIFMQLALRRYGGDLSMAYRSVGRALLLCGGTATAGFGSLGFSSNAGMASLGRICAIGIACNMLISILLLPIWWKVISPKTTATRSPSRFYSARVWQMALALAKTLPAPVLEAFAKTVAAIYWLFAARRREIVIQNLLPVLDNDRPRAHRASRELFSRFAIKLTDLWRYECGVPVEEMLVHWNGWEHYLAAHARGRGVLLVTPHLGNWELGGPFLIRHNLKLLVITQQEPDDRLTAIRQQSRARWGIETLVIGDKDAFAFVEIIKRLQEGTTVALLMDRPPAPTGVEVELFGRKFLASIAAAELARASGCAILPSYIVRSDNGYHAEIFPETKYDRATIGNREERIKLTRQIAATLEPGIRKYATQWYHFVPIWPHNDK
ncbi:MAG TPA: MMPL family transporter [Verrucomicrobiae bacterium]|jgi:predicted exporter/predicted LPLAT superfamily acyltransferase